MLSVFLRQRPGAPVVLVGGIHWRILPPCRCLFERRRGRVNSGDFSGIFLSVLVGVLDFRFVDFLVCFSVLPRPECRRAGLAFWRFAIRLFERRQGRLSSGYFPGEFLPFFDGFQGLGFVVLSDDFSVSETGVPGGWTRVSEDLGSRYLCDGEAG